MAKVQSDTLYGTLNLLILKILAEGPRHGLGVLRGIEVSAGEALRIEEGALYPALHRLERDGLVEGEWGLSENKRRAKFYALTESGRATLDSGISRWQRHASAVARVLDVEVEAAR